MEQIGPSQEDLFVVVSMTGVASDDDRLIMCYMCDQFVLQLIVMNILQRYVSKLYSLLTVFSESITTSVASQLHMWNETERVLERSSIEHTSNDTPNIGGGSKKYKERLHQYYKELVGLLSDGDNVKTTVTIKTHMCFFL